MNRGGGCSERIVLGGEDDLFVAVRGVVVAFTAMAISQMDGRRWNKSSKVLDSVTKFQGRNPNTFHLTQGYKAPRTPFQDVNLPVPNPNRLVIVVSGYIGSPFRSVV